MQKVESRLLTQHEDDRQTQQGEALAAEQHPRKITKATHMSPRLGAVAVEVPFYPPCTLTDHNSDMPAAEFMSRQADTQQLDVGMNHSMILYLRDFTGRLLIAMSLSYNRYNIEYYYCITIYTVDEYIHTYNTMFLCRFS